MTRIICPKCGSKRIAENRWGKHIFTEKLFNEVEKGHVRIKKGKKKESSREYWCHKCQKDFGRSRPRYPAETISRFCLSIGDAANGHTTVEIYPIDKVIMAVVDYSIQDVIIPNRPALWVNGKLWNAFTKKLLKDNLLLEWAKRYEGAEGPSQMQWSLDIQFSLSKHLRWSGTNQWPPYWNAMLKRLLRLLRRSLSGTETDKVTRVWLEQCLSRIEAGSSPQKGTAALAGAEDGTALEESSSQL
ncbi:MAG: hypothetical protein KIG68_08915 [Oxalobacter sp.]|nr:hypothetical protein [Oxalobacter sp.]